MDESSAGSDGSSKHHHTSPPHGSKSKHQKTTAKKQTNQSQAGSKHQMSSPFTILSSVEDHLAAAVDASMSRPISGSHAIDGEDDDEDDNELAPFVA
jgi:hypothetical protein